MSSSSSLIVTIRVGRLGTLDTIVEPNLCSNVRWNGSFWSGVEVAARRGEPAAATTIAAAPPDEFFGGSIDELCDVIHIDNAKSS